jgi:hypothetical protein
MAEVDFSNARIELDTRKPDNPTVAENVALTLAGGRLYDASGNSIVSSYNISNLINQQKQLMYLYHGTFNASGTEVYLTTTNFGTGWKITNISFQSGDTYVFQINATLVCN